MNKKGNDLEMVKCPKRNLQIGDKYGKSEVQLLQNSKKGINCRTRVSSESNSELSGEKTCQYENGFSNKIYSNRHQRKRKMEISENQTENERTEHFIKLLPYQPDTMQKKARYSCTECMKTFSAKTSVTRHRRTHTGERPFQCTECEKRFIQNGDLIRHQRSHSGERPYTCTECDKSFGQRGHLRNHQRIHNKKNNLEMLKIKPSSTEEEQQSFCTEHEENISEQIYVNDYQKNHTREKPYSSSECKKAFKWKDDLIARCITTNGELSSPYSERDENFAQNVNLLLKQKMLGEEGTGKTHTIMVKLIEVTIINDYFVQHIVDSEEHQNGEEEPPTRILQSKALR